ncbi:MAG: GNAT family N-acyltransferase [bacterium]
MQTIHTLDGPDIPSATWHFPGLGLANLATHVGRKVLQLDKLSELYTEIQETPDSRSFADRTLSHLNVSYTITQGGLEAIPREGPLLIVANHPFGGVEGLILLSLLTAVRPDIKLMANQVLSGIPELHRHMILVDLFGNTAATAKNTSPVRQSLRWLKNGGALAMFPSGEVAHFDPTRRRICESDWHTTVARLTRHSGASVLPVFFEGANGPLFQIAGLIHPRLRTALLAREIINKAGHRINVSIGQALRHEKLMLIQDDQELTRYLKMRVQCLGVARTPTRKHPAKPVWTKRLKPVIPAVSANSLAREISWLRPEQQLHEVGDYRVYISTANQIPCVIREIARLREVTFRAVGEGTGQTLDIDVFDRIYQHLFVWNQKTSEVVGAYRLGLTDKIIPQYGIEGLYTSTLFRYDWKFIDSLCPAIEIGRSFVRKEYQRKHLPLLLLWKGIGTFVARNPKYRNLFGTVSMSNHYHETSRQLLARFFEQEKQDGPSPLSVRPRNPFHIKENQAGPALDLACRIPDLEALSEIVGQIESDGKEIPVLIRQYLKMGGRVLSCNVDPKFSMALDALLVVDLARTDPRLLELYMGKHAGEYLRHHGVVTESERQAQCA